MIRMRCRMSLALLVTTIAPALIAGCASARPWDGRRGAADAALNVPNPPREARGAWVATVANIDWPSQPGLSTSEQQRELIAILDEAADLNLNIVVLQVRPAADALYESELEPWSLYLTGQQGQPPEPYYDPLAFACAEAHARGLELHAWLNPFRAGLPNVTEFAENHVSRTHPTWVKRYGGYLWLDPGEAGAREHSLNVVSDLVERYDLDGVHVDDYFYPYPVNNAAGEEIPFPDDASWEAYQQSGGTLARNDWRRENIHAFVSGMYERVKAIDPACKVGISPFGIWRPGYPEQIQGFDAYDKLYADALVWLQRGWIDYFTPQLYWAIDPPAQSYPVLLEWWLSQNTLDRAVWPGNAASRVASRQHNWPATELEDQIYLTRASEATGNIHFSFKAIQQNRGGLRDMLSLVYAVPALPPAMPWMDSTRPAAPRVASRQTSDGAFEVVLSRDDVMDTRWWCVQARYGAAWRVWTAPVTTERLTLPVSEPSGAAELVVVHAIDRSGNASDAVVLRPR